MSTKSRTTIEPLSDHPSALPVVARWVWETWKSKTYEETLASLDNPAKCPPTLVALVAGRPVGVIGFGRFRRAEDTVETLWINALYVVEVERSRGLGSRLLVAAVDIADSWADQLYVYTDLPTWYEHRGWTVIDSTDGGSVLRCARPGAH
jgi:GNAT superfamily N-acetyltransferase